MGMGSEPQSWAIKGMGNPLSGRLGRRLLGWFLLFSLLPLFVSNTVGYLKSQDIIEELVEHYLATLADVEAQHIRGQVERYLLDLQAIAAGNEFLAAGIVRAAGRDAGDMGAVASPAAMAQYLERKHLEMAGFESIFVGRTDGSVLIATEPVAAALPGFHLAGTAPMMLERLEGSAAGAEPRFRLCVPVRNGAGEIVGLFGGVIGQRGIATFLEIPDRLAGSIESFILDEYGRPLFVSHTHEPAAHGLPLASPLLGLEPGAFARYRDAAGSEVIATSVPVEGFPWHYVAEAPLDAALAPLRMLRGVSALLEGLLAVGLAVLAWLVAGQIVAPVRRLVAAARRVGQGEAMVSVEPAGSDEIGELTTAFNDMTTELATASARVRQLHQREIERANQLATVGELASGVAHELKNPLVGVSNGMDLVRRRVGEDPSVAPIMDEMARQLDRMHGAVRDLLTFARPTAPKLEALDANTVLDRAARLVQPAAEHAGVEQIIRAARELPPLRADEELLRQALVNLAMNAVQATPEGGCVSLSSHYADGCVEMRVSDTGRGIPRDQLADIFKPFFTTRHNGTGLGLSITREIVERHGGRLDVRSRLGHGTTFSIHLPVNMNAGCAHTGARSLTGART
ncbi:MAG: ATP-binding protein [Gemmatimonadota bacterium]